MTTRKSSMKSMHTLISNVVAIMLATEWLVTSFDFFVGLFCLMVKVSFSENNILSLKRISNYFTSSISNFKFYLKKQVYHLVLQ